jgi:hypothetical protein
MSTVDIYDGREFIGHVVERHGGKAFRAVAADGRILGEFPSRLTAARAVYRAATIQQQVAAA